MLYVVAFRWTAVTGGENGLGGIVRPDIAGLRLETNADFYGVVAVIAFVVVYLLWRFHRSPAGTCWSRSARTSSARSFIGYPTNRYKLVAFTLSAALTGLAGCCCCSTTAWPRPIRSRSRSPASCWRWWSSAACARSSGPRWARCSS